MPDQEHLAALSATTALLFQKSSALFWTVLPVGLLLAMLTLYISGEMSGGKLEGLFRRLLVAILLLVGFPEISRAIQGIEVYLIDAFGGDTALTEVFAKLAERAAEAKTGGSMNWLSIGQISLNVITTLSFLILALVRRFLDVLHLSLWNLLHVLGPLALLGCLFPTFVQVPKGIFMGMLELALWKPIWILMARLLVSVGFGEQPKDVSQWFDTAVLNFTVAGMMASTPILVHAFLAGTLASMGGAAIQTLVSGTGAMLSAQPMRAIQGGAQWISQTASQSVRGAYQRTQSQLRRNNHPPSKPI